jgi:hypothetical protein
MKHEREFDTSYFHNHIVQGWTTPSSSCCWRRWCRWSWRGNRERLQRWPPSCGDPRLPIWNTRYAYNSRSHDQCVVNPHIQVDNRITSSFTVPNNIITIGHMTKSHIASQGKSTTKQWIPSSVDDPRHAYYPTGNWLGDVPSSHRRCCSHHHRQ